MELAQRPDGSMVAIPAQAREPENEVAAGEQVTETASPQAAVEDRELTSSTEVVQDSTGTSTSVDEGQSAPVVEAVRFDHPGTILVPSGEKSRARANIAAARLAVGCRDDNRYATAAEQRVLSQWSGWGAVPDIFDPNKSNWAEERAELRELLSATDYDSARRSTLNAHYTDPRLVSAMWDALQEAGFDGGRVLEPGCGSGTFMAMAPDTAVMVGVEKDSMTAQIAHLLNPQAQVRLEGFETTTVPQGAFAATIGNVPFAKTAVHDPVYNPDYRYNLHNHFLIKSLHLTAPGGWVMGITTHSTMDAVGAAGVDARREMAELADLVGAVRLPSSTFREVAGTDVTTDLLIFRRREEPLAPNVEPDWVQTRMVDLLDRDGETKAIAVNAYFADHPERVAGQMQLSRGLYRDGSLTVAADEAHLSIPEHVRAILGDIVVEARRDGLTHAPIITSSAEQDVDAFREGLADATELYAGVPIAGTVRWNEERNEFESYVSAEGGQPSWEPLSVAKSRVGETRHLLELRDLTVAVIGSQTSGADLAVRNDLRIALNRSYDSYVSTYGPINRFVEQGGRERTDTEVRERMVTLEQRWRIKNGTRRLDGDGEPVLDAKGKPIIDAYPGMMPPEEAERIAEEATQPTAVQFRRNHMQKLRDDPMIATLMAIEIFNEDTQTARKAALFHRDVYSPPSRVERADTPQDAVAISLGESGRVDLGRVSQLLATDRDDAREQLRGLVYAAVDGSDDLLPAAEFLSGNVREKYAAAKTLLDEATDDQVRHDLRESMEALAEVIPRDLQPNEIGVVKPGVNWIEKSDYAQFASEVLGAGQCRVERGAGLWTVNVRQYSVDVDKFYTDFGAPNEEPRKARTAGELFESLLNQESVSITNSTADVEQGAPVIDQQATLMAQVQMTKIAEEFAQWVWSDQDRTERLVRVFNDRFNSFVAGKYDGTHLSLPGVSAEFEPHPYQRNAVARALAEPTVLLDHVVGAGKTGTMFMTAMELKRRGLVKQPWIVVPTHLIEQVAREAKQWYPAANVLAGRKSMDAEARRLLVSQSATADWDMVLVPASVFELIPTHPDRQANYMRAQLAELEHQLESGGAQERSTVKRIEQAKARLEKRIKSLTTGKRSKDTGLYFEQTGADYLIVDEAHGYKNKARECAIDSLSHPGSQKAEDLALKLSHLRELAQGRAMSEGRSLPSGAEKVAMFATGTPIANSLAEAWVMQQYLRPDVLETAGVHGVTDWAATFTKTRQETITNATGTRLQVVSTVSSYNNPKAMYALSQQFTDVVTRAQVPAKLPRFDGRRMITTEPGQAVRDFIADLEYRGDSPEPDARIDNPLKILNDGRNVALDPRLVGLTPEKGTTRAETVADEISRIYHRDSDRTYLTEDRSTVAELPGSVQIAFCDRGTPKPDGSWTVYSAIKDELIERGVAAEHIRFIHDAKTPAQRLKLFDDCKTGKVRVLIGSTERMGTGVNVQARLAALHHIDVPWRPADLEQREGRILRQGNQNEDVEILQYVTAGTTDTVMWGKVEMKSRFIDEYKMGQLSNTDELGEIDSESLTEAAAATKAAATGDMRFIKMVELEDEVSKLTAMEAAHRDTQAHARRRVGTLDREIPAKHAQIEALADITAAIENWDNDGRQFAVLDGHGNSATFDERPERSAALMERARETYFGLKGRGASDYRPIATFPETGIRLDMSRSIEGDMTYFRFSGPALKTPQYLPSMEGEVFKKPAGPATASGFATRVENHFAKLGTLPEQLTVDVEDMTRERDMLIPPHGHTVRALRRTARQTSRVATDQVGDRRRSTHTRGTSGTRGRHRTLESRRP
ncbi:DEAD/DEAH box helicase family protein (plasmid) [Gordonia amicalis]|nr:DEAD/DEAH box helicase family protein [Gordonia amicalis]